MRQPLILTHPMKYAYLITSGVTQIRKIYIIIAHPWRVFTSCSSICQTRRMPGSSNLWTINRKSNRAAIAWPSGFAIYRDTY